ncbi:cytosolic sulfotransferase 12-like [Triticum dicoccoides]|uniref:cytosolic sulfotransferase 12-like n=1 Tax=Triticum dicoccoides TaxID=85692 RepID=UPI00188E54E8|nr:cytosolic sulfotransferase 12-like [Triticum dicoccoides]
MAPSIGDDDMAERLVVSSLPLETRFPPFQLRQHGGFWFPEPILRGIVAVRAVFAPRPSDVFLASFPKSGTTWLKALAFATVHRADHPPCAPDHPLRLRNPHDCVEFLEVPYALTPDADAFAALPSPRVIPTHMPYSLLPERVTAEGAGCKVVYVCRDPKDAFVSVWLFAKKTAAAAAAEAANDDEPRPVPTPFGMEEAFELLCDGRCPGGPQWPHVLSYWEASRRWPERVLFLRYEEMLGDPVGNVRKLAEFMGCAFSEEEEAAGVARDIVELCSIGALKNVEANKSGAQNYVRNEAFFRKGVAGDWSNHMTPEMAALLDGVVEDALQGSGFSFPAAESA